MSGSKIGLWLIGARGGVATTAITGLAALQKGRMDETGLVTGLPRWSDLPFPAWDEFLVGGHEIRETSLFEEAMHLAKRSRAFEPEMVHELREEYEAIDTRIRTGLLHKVGPTIESLASSDVPRGTPAEDLRRIQEDLCQFHDENELEHVVVVNVASTEPPVEVDGLPETWKETMAALESADCPFPASSLYAIAALDLGFSFINFTPSLGCVPAGIDELARLRKARHMGRDGKTGETLMKSVLAPMFHDRNLRVMSWVGHNIFGNLDGKVLDDPANKATKVASKDRLLGEILGYRPQTLVSIEYIESMGDWKTAWDHIHFQGFLGTRHAVAVHLAGMRLTVGGAAGPRFGAVRRIGTTAGPGGADGLSGQFLQESGRSCRAGVCAAVPDVGGVSEGERLKAKGGRMKVWGVVGWAGRRGYPCAQIRGIRVGNRTLRVLLERCFDSERRESCRRGFAPISGSLFR